MDDVERRWKQQATELEMTPRLACVVCFPVCPEWFWQRVFAVAVVVQIAALLRSVLGAFLPFAVVGPELGRPGDRLLLPRYTAGLQLKGVDRQPASA